MGKITFILGGTGSGKSSYTVELAKKNYKKVAFVATCPYFDEETREKIKLRKQERPAEWKTYEEFTNLPSLLDKLDKLNEFDLVIIDCLTLFVSNLMLEGLEEEDIRKKINEMINVLKNAKYTSFVITNEVGLSADSESKSTRKYKDISGRLNQIVARKVESVYLIVAGLPLKLKEVKDPLDHVSHFMLHS
ncbi:MAG: hypothetical protein A2104_02220 [Candidatus Melainabacteria bacterium GWF2_32_7]|nr:MAG: hypothetical protein A2104_02220 [Candidatus Melainabacteria bacterium GWF2_32_7]